MPHTPGLTAPSTPPLSQSDRYDNLAAWAHKTLTIDGQPRYPVAGLRRQLAAAHVIAKDGTVKRDQLVRMMRALGMKDAAKHTPGGAGLDAIVEGRSP